MALDTYIIRSLKNKREKKKEAKSDEQNQKSSNTYSARTKGIFVG